MDGDRQNGWLGSTPHENSTSDIFACADFARFPTSSPMQIQSVKEKIKAKEGFDVEAQKLIHSGT